jgi:hypothetical protein
MTGEWGPDGSLKTLQVIAHKLDSDIKAFSFERPIHHLRCKEKTPVGRIPKTSMADLRHVSMNTSSGYAALTRESGAGKFIRERAIDER